MSNSLPKISIVTPSYNQGEFLEETICSVLDQNYPNLEYFIVDGGSTDQSVEIIKQYADHLTWWISEKDNGQSHAINKGFARATGAIFGWINSDDYYLPGAFEAVKELYQQNPEAVAWVGQTLHIDREGNPLCVEKPKGLTKAKLSCWGFHGLLPQQSCFFSAEAFQLLDGLRVDLHYAMDMDFWIRLTTQGHFHLGKQTLAAFRIYPGTKTQGEQLKFYAEVIACGVNHDELDAAGTFLRHLFEREYARGVDGSLHAMPLLQAVVTLIGSRLNNFYRIRFEK